MRILIFSDLHANLEALMALQSVERRPDAVFFLGDAVGYGPDPLPCTAWLKSNASVCVQGDHDAAAATGAECASPPEWRDAAHATQVLHRMLLPATLLRYLGALPPSQTVEMGGARFYLMHRLVGACDIFTATDGKLEAALAGALDHSHADVILCGHTHIPALRRVGKRWIANPGSLGQPRHGVPSCTYAIWEDGNLSIQHIDYDPHETMQKLALLPLDPEFILRLRETLRTGL